jgi:alpha-1,2-mannosyltransferase
MVPRLLHQLRRADWLTRDRVIAWSSVMFIIELLVLVFLALWQRGLLGPAGNSPASDFVSFYAAGKLAIAGTPQLAYDQSAHYLVQQYVTGTSAAHQFFFYPPVFMLLCAPLATMSYLVAFAVFVIATLAIYLAVMAALVREPAPTWVPPVLAFPAVFWTIGLGQNAFLTAALFGGFTLLLKRRPLAAGLLLGLLCYKPHFGLLVPVALLAGREWRAIVGAAISISGLIVLSLAVFGWETWTAYLAAFVHSDQVYTTGRVDFAGVITPFGASRLLGLDTSVAYAIQIVATMVAVIIVALVWRRSTNHNLRCATLLAATLFAVPLALLYDQLLLCAAVAWLIREARQTGLLNWEAPVLVATYPVSLITLTVGQGYHVPLGLLTTGAVLALCLRRTWQSLPMPAVRDYVAPLGVTP